MTMLGRISRQGLGRSLTPAIAVLALLVAGFWTQWAGLAGLWTGSLVWTHGWLIIGVSLWLLYGACDLPLPPLRPSVLRLLPLIGALGLFVFAQFAYIDLAQQSLLPLIGIALTYAIFGPTGVQRFGFALAYVLFAIPVWDVLIPTLQALTVEANEFGLWIAGVPAQIAGDTISVPCGNFVVEGGCSGSHFFVVALAVSSLHAKLWQMSRRMSLGAVLFASALALLANWVRVYVIIMRAIATEMQTSLIKDHYWFGWFLFAGALLVYFLTLRHFDPGAPAHPAPPAAARDPRRFAALPWVKTLIPACLLLSLVNLHFWWFEQSWSAVQTQVRTAPAFAQGWSGPLLQDTEWRPVFKGANSEMLATYHNAHGRVSWFEAIYRKQHPGAKLIGYGNSQVPQEWSIRSEKEFRKSKHTDYTSTQVPVLVTTAQSQDGSRWRIWSWYRIEGHSVAEPWAARVRMGLQGFTSVRPTPAAAVALAAECQPNCESADAQLQLFLDRLDGDHT